VKRRTILIAGGGTGGHVFPAVAVAEAIQALADVEAVFCGTSRGLEERVVPARGFRLERLRVEPIQGGGVARAARGTLVALGATGRAFGLVRRVAPSAVLSVGGYAAGPVSLAAALSRIPLAVLEPNSVAGLANRLLEPLARRAYVAWDRPSGFRAAHTRSYGVPLRAGFGPKPYAPRGPCRLLVLGGSQGAAALNDRLPAAVQRLGGGAGLRVLHQAGKQRDESVRQAYGRHKIDGATVVPFLDDVASAIADADVVVARAGAGTLAEIAAIGRAAVLVPFPYAADDHQTKNAAALVSRGAAVCLRESEASVERIATEIQRLTSDDPARAAMAAASMKMGRPAAAFEVASDLLAVAGIALRGAVG
jgi:UDP-N-acetylglucosamine--N-acetylmuramyl-(pentapeptide) pyrophosphoryl-undecaprenol N-acetylglucosamine transferase